MRNLKVDDMKVRLYHGGTVGVVTGVARGEFKQGSRYVPGSVLYTETFVKDDDVGKRLLLTTRGYQKRSDRRLPRLWATLLLVGVGGRPTPKPPTPRSRSGSSSSIIASSGLAGDSSRT